tara:strand:- start:624 stop:1661 length:1038 start_codon:yes stop_codon:yes gene_type:complete
MAFQNTAGTIIIDAVLTDIGRRHMVNGSFEVSKFALGDSEIDYSFGHSDATKGNGNGDGYYYLYGDQNGPFPTSGSFAPVLEATTNQETSLIHSLTNLYRDDVLYLPKFFANSKINNSVSLKDGVYYLAANSETAKKLKNHLNINTELLTNNETLDNMIVIESGINNNQIAGNKKNRDRFIYNLKLSDTYVMIYCNKSFFDNILVNNTDAYFKNNDSGHLFESLLPLVEVPKTSLKNFIKEYDTYYCKTVQNLVTDGTSGTAAQAHSSITGPRSNIFSLGFKLNPKLTSLSNGASDRRYELFGKQAQTLFGGSDTFDYIDSRVMIEGISSTSTFDITIRIIRYAG